VFLLKIIRVHGNYFGFHYIVHLQERSQLSHRLVLVKNINYVLFRFFKDALCQRITKNIVTNVKWQLAAIYEIEASSILKQ